MLDIRKAAQAIAQRRLAGIAGPRYAVKDRPRNCLEAWQIQLAVSEYLLEHAGITLAGWKCGLGTSERWIVAPLYSSGFFNVSRNESLKLHPFIPRAQAAAVEPEYAFLIRHSLSPRPAAHGISEIDQAIGSSHIALELIADRFDDPAPLDFPELLADGLFNQGVVVGPEIPSAPAACALSVGHHHGVFHYQGKHPDGNPKAPLYWLANFLREQVLGLQPGQVVITGSLAGVWQVPLQTPARFGFSGCGEFVVEFIPGGFYAR